MSGAGDGTIRVWDAGTGALEATLTDHGNSVTSLVVHEDRLLSASDDGTIRAWAVETWGALQTVAAYGEGEGLYTGQFPCCLAVSGGRLVSGSAGHMRVWDVATLECDHTLRQPAPARRVHGFTALRRWNGRCGAAWGARWWCEGGTEMGADGAGACEVSGGCGRKAENGAGAIGAEDAAAQTEAWVVAPRLAGSLDPDRWPSPPSPLGRSRRPGGRWVRSPPPLPLSLAP